MEFHSVVLPPAEEASIRARLMKQVQTAILTTPASRLLHASHDGFAFQDQHRGVRLYTRKSYSDSGDETMSVGYSNLPFESIMYLMLAQSTEDHRVQQTLFYEEAFLDGSILATGATPTEEDPFQWFGIKYAKVALANYRFVDPRDMVYAELSGTTVNMDGHSVLFVMRESVSLQDVPLVPDAIRCRLKSLTLHTECPNGTIEHVHFAYMNPFGSVPAFLFKATQLRQNTLMERYAQMVHFKRMLDMSMRSSFFPNSQKACATCMRSFWALTSRYFCRSCGDVICGKCCIFIPRPKTQLFQTNLTIVKEEYCKSCYLSVRDPTMGDSTGSSLLSTRHLSRPATDAAATLTTSQPCFGSSRSLHSMPMRSLKSPTSRQATLSMIPPLRG
ncbi:Aste57867_3980 [Aphanomyces stellatus]|uniref:Aste57867_3980 protein n=1 Tax=Aphanomyces stellatus TaxID=120398 RepID=A0A485KCC8_9STRA|nr:hypothetical protein As57867_003969 [Aphanomyces stellatus]VFT81117.1 Aste57867_3980 [Aphanomyces stellatus]